MSEGDNAVHIRIVGQWIIAGERVAAEHIRDDAGDVSRAVHAGQDADVVPRGDAPVRSANALEARGCRVELGGAGVDAVGIVLCEIAHFAIIDVHVLAGRNGGGREADYLAVAPDRVPDRDWSGCDLVARRNTVGGLGEIVDAGSRQQGRSGNNYVVLGMQANDERGGHGGFLAT